MKKMSHTQLFKVCLLSMFSFSALADIVVVVHKDNVAAISEKTISNIFMGKESQFSDGTAVVPYNVASSSKLRDEFNENVIGRSTSKVNAYWSKLIFTGKGAPPKELANDAEILSMVASNPAAIGYVESKSVNDSVKIIATF